MRVCSICKRDDVEFYSHHSACKVCTSEKTKEYRQRNSKKIKSRKLSDIQIRQDLISRYKIAHGCRNCAIRDPIVLDLHHRDPKDKSFAVSRMAREKRSIADIENELLKCDVLCANCHRIEHHNKRKNLN